MYICKGNTCYFSWNYSFYSRQYIYNNVTYSSFKDSDFYRGVVFPYHILVLSITNQNALAITCGSKNSKPTSVT